MFGIPPLPLLPPELLFIHPPPQYTFTVVLLPLPVKLAYFKASSIFPIPT
jgi:hypothetical protein